MFADSSEVVAAYVDMLTLALPVTFIFGACNILVDIVCKAFFTGKLRFGGRG